MAKKNVEIREQSPAELEKMVRDAEDELVTLRLRKQTGQIDKPHRLKELRRNIARLKTFLNNKKTASTDAAV